MSVLPRSRRRSRVLMSLRLSRWCRPIDGSSRMYRTPISLEPIWVASRIRCDSPPDSVLAARSTVKYSSPTSIMNCSRSRISFKIPRAISCSRSVSASPSKKPMAPLTDNSHTWAMLRSATVTARDSGFNRWPLQVGDHALERRLVPPLVPVLVLVSESDLLVAGPVEEHIAVLLAHLRPRLVHVDAEVLAHRLQQLGVEELRLAPRCDRALAQR